MRLPIKAQIGTGMKNLKKLKCVHVMKCA